MLLDSNILIYAGKPEFSALKTQYITANARVSVIGKIEVLGYHRLDENVRELLRAFFDTIQVIELTDEITTLAIFLRQQRRMTLGDAIIAATALMANLPLITRNDRDFHWIAGLTLINPIDTTAN